MRVKITCLSIQGTYGNLRQFLQQQIDNLVAEEAKKGARFAQKFEIQPGVAKTDGAYTNSDAVRAEYLRQTVRSMSILRGDWSREEARQLKSKGNPAASEAVEFPPANDSVLAFIDAVPAGSEVEFVCPSTLAYGSQPVPPMIRRCESRF